MSAQIFTTQRGTRTDLSELIHALLALGNPLDAGSDDHVIVETMMDREARPAVAIPSEGMSPGHRRILAHIVGHFLPTSSPIRDAFADLGAVKIVYRNPDAIGGHEALEAAARIAAFLKDTIGLAPEEIAEEMAS